MRSFFKGFESKSKMASRSLAKDFHKLQKNISSFSNGEAKIVSCEDELNRISIELNIADGLYQDGLFTFDVFPTESYPYEPPDVVFTSQILHPNIGDGYIDGHVCLNLLNEDWNDHDLEDVVQGMLFLIKNPALDDALNPLTSEFSGNSEEDYVAFAELVLMSLEGGEIEGKIFDRNPGLLKKDKIVSEMQKLNCTNPVEVTPSAIECFSSLSQCEPSLFPTRPSMSEDEFYKCALFWVFNNFTNISTNRRGTSQKQTCPKWLIKLAKVIFDKKRTKKKENVNILIKNLRAFKVFPFIQRMLMW